MGMSTYVRAFISPDNEDYKKHSKVLAACAEAGIKELPKETADYFDSSWPDFSLLEEKLEIKIPVHEYEGDMTEGYEVYIADLPTGVYKIRFVNCY